MIGVAELTDEVVCAAVAGDSSACAQVFEQLQPRVRLMVAARLSPTPAQFGALDDLAQEVMVALTTALPNLARRTVAGLNAFVSGILTRQVALGIRRRGFAEAVREHVVSLDATVAALSTGGPLWQFLSGSGTSPSLAAARHEQVQQLMTALGQVKPEHREVITFVFFDELPIAEVAEQMGVSRPAASMLLLRAVHALRRQMTGSSTTGQFHDQR
jgi:RNA polymerase sigma-70 factor (ECF subfamily)